MSPLFQSLDISDDTAFVLSDDISFTHIPHEGNVEWFECRNVISGDVFMLATAAAEETVFQITQLLENEYALRATLADSWALRPLRYTFYRGRYALIYRHFSYRTLAHFLSESTGEIQTFISSAILMCHTLSHLHQQGMVHGNIKPANFFITD